MLNWCFLVLHFILEVNRSICFKMICKWEENSLNNDRISWAFVLMVILYDIATEMSSNYYANDTGYWCSIHKIFHYYSFTSDFD